MILNLWKRYSFSILIVVTTFLMGLYVINSESNIVYQEDNNFKENNTWEVVSKDIETFIIEGDRSISESLSTDYFNDPAEKDSFISFAPSDQD